MHSWYIDALESKCVFCHGFLSGKTTSLKGPAYRTSMLRPHTRELRYWRQPAEKEGELADHRCNAETLIYEETQVKDAMTRKCCTIRKVTAKDPSPPYGQFRA